MVKGKSFRSKFSKIVEFTVLSVMTKISLEAQNSHFLSLSVSVISHLPDFFSVDIR